MLDEISRSQPDEPVADASPIAGETRRLVYSVDGQNLVDNVDLALSGTSLTVVMGPNGAGKSLLLRLMHGLIAPTAGEVRWGGQPMDANLRARQALVFQRPVLLRRSAAANIRFVLKHRGNDSPGRVQELLEEVGLADRADRPARLLSGGEQQRLALARALAVAPRVLFMDEPTTSLDPAATASIESIVMRAHRRGVKIIFVTHDLGQARRLADDVVFLNRGRLVEHSAAARFFQQPESRAARDYLSGRLVLER
ncbi:MAG: ATP-binding cassette domain-containing protein [Wenzhouxiangellaceae bacterium]|nr:ATP-binding cassette domain-containing protein [Wenzhouxiangellaceae bacterium]